MTDPDDMPAPGLAPAFTLVAAPVATVRVGRLATGGLRSHQSFANGVLAGERLNARLVSGGETLLARPDGVTTVEAYYLLADEAGQAIRLIGTGYETADGSFVGTRMTIVFETGEDGPHAWLTTRAWLAERAAASDILVICEIL